MASQRVVIVGNGIAGVLVASRMRFQEPDPAKVSITIFSSEAHEHYARIRLPEVFVAELGAEALRIYNPSWYGSRSIEVHRGETVLTVDAPNRTVVTTGGRKVAYDDLVLCTGSEAVRLEVPGATLEGVFTVREHGDADAIRRYLARGCRHVAVVGGGLLGVEAAHFLQQAGVSVTILEREDRLLPRQLDETGSRILQTLVERPRCRVVLSARVQRLEGNRDVRAVALEDGSEIGAQLVLVTAGVTPRATLARDAGLRVGQGVVVDDLLRTSDPHVWAAGDVVEFQGEVWGIIPAAMEHASVVAANVLGKGPVRYHRTIPRNTLKVTGIELESMGEVHLGPGRGVTVIEQTNEPKGRHEKYVLRDGALVGCILLGSRENHDFAAKHIGRATTEAEVRAVLR